MANSTYKVLVTGGSGYLGEQLVISALSHGYKVRSFDLLPPVTKIDKVEYFVGDIRDTNSLNLATEGVDFIIHAVASVPLRKSNVEFKEVNVGGTQKVLDMGLRNKVKKIVYISSSAVFGVPDQNPVLENVTPVPAESYGQAKLDAEQLCAEYVSQGLDITIIRPRTILGAGRLGIFGIFFKWIRDGASVPVLGSGDNVYQFVHVDDLCEAILLSMRHPGSSTYNIGADEPVTMKESLSSVCNEAANGSRVFSIPKQLFKRFAQITNKLGLAPFAPYHWIMYGESLWFDSRKAKNELGWSPRFSSTEALIQSYRTFLESEAEAGGEHLMSPHRSSPKQGVLKVLQIVSKAIFSR